MVRGSMTTFVGKPLPAAGAPPQRFVVHAGSAHTAPLVSEYSLRHERAVASVAGLSVWSSAISVTTSTPWLFQLDVSSGARRAACAWQSVHHVADSSRSSTLTPLLPSQS